MIIFPYPKPTKCYGDTVIRRAEKVDSITEKVDFSRYYLVISQILSSFDKGTAIKQGL